ncbi:MAG: holo-ACP synthase [Chloroflexi bacterium]|nr:holo-ACP synthase [Chloroflexota bacterium]
MNLRTGVDLIEIERVEATIQRYGQRFLERIFTPRELAEVGENVASLAVRFAAKEATAKALGTGIGDVGWQEIEILRGPARQPNLYLHGRASDLAESLDLETWSLSLTHNKSHAIALVVAIGD